MPPYAGISVTRDTSRARKGGKDLTIVSALFALLADHVLGVVATARRSYLIEFNRYLDEQQLTDPSKPRSTPA